jgi:hypothetical protein
VIIIPAPVPPAMVQEETSDPVESAINTDGVPNTTEEIEGDAYRNAWVHSTLDNIIKKKGAGILKSELTSMDVHQGLEVRCNTQGGDLLTGWQTEEYDRAEDGLMMIRRTASCGKVKDQRVLSSFPVRTIAAVGAGVYPKVS